MTKQHPGAELDEPGLDRRRRRLSPDRQPLGCSPHQRWLSHRIRRRQLQEAPSVGRKRIEPPPKALLDPPRQRHTAEEPEPAGEVSRRESPCQLQQRKRVAARLADDLLADPRSSGPVSTESSSARASSSRKPWRSSCGNLANSSLTTRAAKTKPTDSASRRRATNARTCAEARSSHCSSSTRQISGRSSATTESRLRTARPMRKRSGADPELKPNAVRNASRCGPGSRSR